MAALRELGCDLVQGRHVGLPVAACVIEDRLTRASGGKHRLPVPQQASRGPEEPQGARVSPA